MAVVGLALDVRSNKSQRFAYKIQFSWYFILLHVRGIFLLCKKIKTCFDIWIALSLSFSVVAGWLSRRGFIRFVFFVPKRFVCAFFPVVVLQHAHRYLCTFFLSGFQKTFNPSCDG